MPQENNFEAKFGQISDAVIYDRAPMLSKWKVGFQVLESNDEETRAAGVMAYKIGRQWAYVPSFWLDGKLKGTNLLYLRQQDVFVPNKESWINYVLAKLPMIMGEGADKPDDYYGKTTDVGRRAQGEVSFDLGFGQQKSASKKIRRGDLDLLRPLDKEAMMSRPISAGINLEEWIPMFGKTAALSFAHSLAKNEKLALAVSRYHDPEELAALLIKTASVEETVNKKKEVKVITSPFDKEAQSLSPTQREKLASEGMLILEDEPATGAAHEVNVEAGTLGSIEGPGRYEILNPQGKYDTYTLAGPLKYTKYSGELDPYAGGAYPFPDDQNEKEKGAIYVALSGDNAGGIVQGRKAFAKKIEDFSLRGKKLEDPMEALRGNTKGEKLFIVSREGEAVLVRTEGSGIVSVLASHTEIGDVGTQGEQTARMETTGRPGRLNLSGGVLYIPSEGVAVVPYNRGVSSPNDYRFTESPEIPLGDESIIPWTLEKEGFARIKVYTDGCSQWSISGPRGTKAAMDKAASVRELIGGYGLSADIAVHMIDKELSSAVSHGHPSASRYWISKEAVNYMDEQAVTETKATQKVSPLEDGEVAEIEEDSDKGVQEVLDVSILKALARRADVEEMVSSFMSDLVKAMDRIGRLLFLFYWNNEDFMETYGTQEMYELETSLTDVFEGLSSLILFLNARKARSAAIGSSDDGGLEGGLGGF